MLDFLFRRLTAGPKRGTALFEQVTKIARAPHWYVEGKVPDTLDGRFAVLATLTAVTLIRLEKDGEEGDAASVALTERFIELMEAEHREMGLGDPKLGRTVRKLVGSLSRRVDSWREARPGDPSWQEATRESLYRDHAPAGAIRHSARAIRDFFGRLARTDIAEIADGRVA